MLLLSSVLGVMEVIEERFKPFVRHDVAVLSSPYEFFKTVFMSFLFPFRVLFTFVLLIITALICRLSAWGLADHELWKVFFFLFFF